MKANVAVRHEREQMNALQKELLQMYKTLFGVNEEFFASLTRVELKRRVRKANAFINETPRQRRIKELKDIHRPKRRTKAYWERVKLLNN